MKSKIASFIISLVIILIVSAVVVLGVIIYQDILGMETAVVTENFIGNYQYYY